MTIPLGPVIGWGWGRMRGRRMMKVSILIEHRKLNQFHIKLFITFEIYFALIQLEKVLSIHTTYNYAYVQTLCFHLHH